MSSEVRLLCRVCANPSVESIMFRLFDDDTRNPFRLAEIFQFVSGIQVVGGDCSVLPNNCCLDCMNRLHEVEDLRNLCQESDRKLRQMIGSDVTEEEQSVEQNGSDVDDIPHHVEVLEEYLIHEDGSEEKLDFDDDLIEYDSDEMLLNSSISEESITDIASVVVLENGENHCFSDDPDFLVENTAHSELNIPKRRGRKPKIRDANEEVQPRVLRRRTSKQNIQDPTLEVQPKVLKKRGRKPKIRDPNAEKTKKSEPICCTSCGKVYKTLFSLREHERIHSSVNRYNCEYCGMGFGKRTMFVLHVRRHKTGKFKCNECEKAFHTEKLLNQHVQIRHRGERPFHCKLCPKTYSRASSLYVHVQVFHEKIRKQIYKCEICSRETFNKNGYERHMNSHRGIKLNQCPCCGKNYEFDAYLAQHIAEKHPETVPNLSRCHYCGLGYSTDGYYRKHIVKRHPEHLQEFDQVMKVKRAIGC